MLEDQKINKARRKWQKQTEFLCTIKFRNSLPDPPLGPHFLEVPLDLKKYVKYRPTTLDSDYKWKVTCSSPTSLIFLAAQCFVGGQTRVSRRPTVVVLVVGADRVRLFSD